MILRSVTSRLIFSYCLLLLLLGGTFILFTVVSFQHYVRETITDNLIARSQAIWNTAEGSLDAPDRLSDLIERRFAPQSQDRFIRIRRGDKLIYRSGNPAERDFLAASVPLSDPHSVARVVLIGDLLLYTRDFQDADGSMVTVDTGQSYRFANDVQGRLATSLFVGLPVLLLFAAFAGYVLMRRALTPVEVMINAAEAYTFNDPHNRLPLIGAEPRIEALGLALNRMLDRLDNAYTHVSRFSADAAHELRTPLTIIRGELELVVTQARTPADIDRAVSNALEEMTRLSSIVDSLITLSRMESLWGKHAHTNVDLAALVTETLDQMSLLAEEKQIVLDKPSAVPVIVAGDRDRLKQVLVNLIDNAIKYTPPGGRIIVNAGRNGDTAFVTLKDTGIGIDPALHERVFDRFYRVSTDRGDIGAGLGLAIVKSICNAHGGTVSLHSALGFGSCFRVELPLQMAGLSGQPDSPENKVAAAGAAAAVHRQNG